MILSNGVKVHVPRVAGVAGVGRRRPVVVRLHICLPTLAFCSRQAILAHRRKASPGDDPLLRGTCPLNRHALKGGTDTP